MLADVVEKIEQRGEKRGEQRGMQQGEKNRDREHARKMLDEGLEIALISRITGLSEQEIKDL